MQIELRHAGKFLLLLELIQIDLEGALQQIPRMEESAVSFVAHSYVFEAMVADSHVGVHILELQPCCGQPPIASTLWADQRTSTRPELWTRPLLRLQTL